MTLSSDEATPSRAFKRPENVTLDLKLCKRDQTTHPHGGVTHPSSDVWTRRLKAESTSSRSTKLRSGTNPKRWFSLSSVNPRSARLRRQMLYDTAPAKACMKLVLPDPGGPWRRYPRRYGIPGRKSQYYHRMPNDDRGATYLVLHTISPCPENLSDLSPLSLLVLSLRQHFPFPFSALVCQMAAILFPKPCKPLFSPLSKLPPRPSPPTTATRIGLGMLRGS